MKRILFVTESLARGGMERVLVDIANALVLSNYDVTILQYACNQELRDDLNSKVHLVYKKRKPLKILRSLPYIHRFYKKEKWESRVTAKTLYKYYVGRTKYDVEIGFYRGPSIKIVSGSTNRHSKKLAWVHTDFKLCDPKSITKFFKSIEEANSAYRKFDKVVCVSNQAKKSFLETTHTPEEKVAVVYNMISAEEIRKKALEQCPIKKQRFTIATVGRLIPDKGYLRLLDVVKKLNNDGYEFDLWIIGGGRADTELQKHATESCINNVVFVGMQKNPYKYLKAADLFVCSSLREGFSLAVAEALLLGVPVLSTRCTGPSEILNEGEFGILVENNEEGLYCGLKKVLENPGVLQEYEKTSKLRGAEFDVNQIIGKIIALIEGEK